MLKMSKKGFTIVELIVAMAIIGILVLLAVPKFNGHTEKARLTALKSNVKQLENASERYYIDNQDWPRLTDTHYTVEQLETFALEIKDKTGATIVLDSNGLYYELDYDKLQKYVQKPKDDIHYILQNPIGEIYYLDKLTEEGKTKLYNNKSREETVAQNQKPNAVITMTPQNNITTLTNIVWDYSNSTDPDGDTIINTEWQGKQDIYTTEGIYTVKLRVQDSKGLWSDWAETTFIVSNNSFKYGLDFQGNSYAQLSKGYGGIPNTLEAYIKVPTNATSNRLGIVIGNYSSSNNINFEIYTSGKPRIWWNNGQVDWVVPNVDVRNSKFTHIAFVRDINTKTYKFYLDGVLTATTSSIGTDVSPSANLRIGADQRAGSLCFHGIIGYVRAWDRPLSETELKNNMDKVNLDNQTGLLGYWSLEEGSGSVINDLSPNKNNGTNNGATWVAIK